MKAILILFSFILLTSCAQQASRNKKLSSLDEKGRVLASEGRISKKFLSRVCPLLGRDLPPECHDWAEGATDDYRSKGVRISKKFLSRVCPLLGRDLPPECHDWAEGGY